jgi:hypothetical protein
VAKIQKYAALGVMLAADRSSYTLTRIIHEGS